jgi:HSP20 family protein
MTAVVKGDTRSTDRIELWDALDGLFGDWAKRAIRVDEFHENGTLVIRAEMPGVDPDKDVELTVRDGMLHIRAERKEEAKTEDKGFVHHELRFGSFARSLPMPAGLTESDVTATYKDGILEIRVPAPAVAVEPAKKIAIKKTA